MWDTSAHIFSATEDRTRVDSWSLSCCVCSTHSHNPVTALPLTIIIMRSNLKPRLTSAWSFYIKLSLAGPHWGFETVNFFYTFEIFHSNNYSVTIMFPASQKKILQLPWWPQKDQKQSRECGQQQKAQDLSPFIRAHNTFQEQGFRGAAGEQLVSAHHSVPHPDERESWQENNEGWYGREIVERIRGATKERQKLWKRVSL